MAWRNIRFNWWWTSYFDPPGRENIKMIFDFDADARLGLGCVRFPFSSTKLSVQLIAGDRLRKYAAWYHWTRRDRPLFSNKIICWFSRQNDEDSGGCVTASIRLVYSPYHQNKNISLIVLNLFISRKVTLIFWIFDCSILKITQQLNFSNCF